MSAQLPQWLTDAITNLVTAAYEAGLNAAASTVVTAPPTKDVFTLAEARSELRVSMATINKLVTTGELGSYHVGKRRFVRATDIEAFRDREQQVAA